MKMKFTVKGLLTLCIIGLLSFVSQAQLLPPNWQFIQTSGNHTYLLPTTASIKIDGVQVVPGDYVGAFYDSSGVLKCAGYTEYSGTTNSVSVWVDDALSQKKDGFLANEVVNWKLFDWSAWVEYDVVVKGYESQPWLIDGTYFVEGGMSSIDTLHAFSELDIKPVGLVAPITSCGLDSNETVSIAVTNIADGDVIAPFAIYFSKNNGATWITSTYSGGVPSGDTVICTFLQTVDFSAFGNVGGIDVDTTYSCKFYVHFVDDINFSNDTAYSTVTNMVPPDVSFSGLSASYCSYDNPVILTGIPSGGIFSASPNPISIANSSFLIPFAGVGHHCVTYHYYDQGTGCTGTHEVCTDIYQQPNATLTTPSLSICQYDTICLTGSPAGGTYHGTYVNPTTGCFNPLTPPTTTFPIYYTYTDSHGCKDTSGVKNFTVYTLPNASFVNLDRAYCTNGSTVTLTGSPAGGMFSISSGVAVTGNQLNPTLLTPGLHTLKYLYIDLHGCKDDEDKPIKAFAPPVVTLTGLESEYCRFDIADTLHGSPSNGVWSGATTTNIFNPTTVGNFNVTYTYDSMRIYVDTVYCSSFDTESTIVRALPVFDLAGSYQLTSWGDIETCKPDTVALTTGSFPNAQYLWSTGATTKNITTQGYGGYTATVTNQYGCNFKDSIFIGGTDVQLFVNLSPASSCTLSNAEPLILKYKNVGTKVFQPSEKIIFNAYYIINGASCSNSNQFDARTVPFKPGDSLTFQFTPNLDCTPALANVGEYGLFAYLHYNNLSGTLPDCKLTNDTLRATIVNGGFPDPSFALPCPIESNSPDTVVLNPGEFVSYQWSTGATTSSITNLNFFTKYTVTVTDEFGCEDTVSCIGIVDIEELPSSYQSMDVYPNPNNGEFTLHVQNKSYTTISFELLDMSGRVITAKEEEKTMEFTQKVNMRERAKGVYFLKVFNGKDYAIQKIIKY